MADSRKTVQIKSDPVGDVRIADEVVAIIAGVPGHPQIQHLHRHIADGQPHL